MYTQQTTDHTKTISPPPLETDFLLDSGATLNILISDNSNEIKKYHKLQLKASTSSHTLISHARELKKNDTKLIKIYDSSTKPLPFYSVKFLEHQTRNNHILPLKSMIDGFLKL